MALTTTDFHSYFRYDFTTPYEIRFDDTTPYEIRFDDTTDYATQGVATSDVKVLIKCSTASGGEFYNNVNINTPDIAPSVSLNSAITIPLPLGNNSLPLQDAYTFTFKSYVSGVLTVTKVKTFTLNYSRPTINISMEVDCITPLLTANDDTNYTVNLVAPTIVRDFKIHYPPSLPTADVTGTGVTLSTSTFYTVANSSIEHSSSLTSTLTYDFGGGFYVADIITGSEVIKVACTGDLYDIYCCIRSQWNRYLSYEKDKSNSVQSARELAIFYQITGLANLVGLALRCTKSTHISDYVAMILKLADCDAGCSCTDGEPQLVTGLGVGGSSITVVAGKGVSVSLSGGAYTVSLSTVNIAKLAATYNTVVAAGTNISSVTSNTVVSGNVTTTTYTVNSVDTITDGLYVDVTISFSSGYVPSYVINKQKRYGTSFRSGLTDTLGFSPFIDISNIGSAADWQNNTVTMKIQNLFSGASVNYYPEVQVISERVKASKSGLTQSKRFFADIYNTDTNFFNLRFINGALGAASGTEMDVLSLLRLIFKIHA